MSETKDTALLRSIPVPPVNSEERFAFTAVEQVLGFALNRHLGKLQSRHFLTKEALREGSGWRDGKPAALLQIKHDTMDEVIEIFTPNLIELARAFYLPGSEDINDEKPVAVEKARPSHPKVHKNALYNLLQNYALSQSMAGCRGVEERGFLRSVWQVVKHAQDRLDAVRARRLSALALNLPLDFESHQMGPQDVAFLNGKAQHFLQQEKEDPFHPYVLEILNGLAFLAKSLPEFDAAPWSCTPYDPARSLVKKFKPYDEQSG
ncbi:hypothetical protein [Acanthopleuribacter pedis]|uniref:Uncharacterized protein n=1 Tax=Acanthopleuribacter pedis TaxID=442870 RepID=A0A8J7U4I1_9BACT|nr:hypothetical protein [Acanthopleuribacter pedis]MBO1320672.1 hypothetical protein [Acanthopleuribacter pedis]